MNNLNKNIINLIKEESNNKILNEIYYYLLISKKDNNESNNLEDKKLEDLFISEINDFIKNIESESFESIEVYTKDLEIMLIDNKNKEF